MKIIKGFLSILSAILLISITSCSSHDKDQWYQAADWFQTNDPFYEGFNLFNIFKGYPTISDAWSKVQSMVFNQGMMQLLADTPTSQLKDVIGLMDDLVDPVLKPSEPLFATLQDLHAIMNRIVNQDSLDAEAGSTTYYTNFISFMDKLSGTNANFSQNLMPIVAKLLMYINVVHATEINEMTNDLLYLMKENGPAYGGLETDGNDPEAQNIYNMLPMLQEALAKLLMLNNGYMYLDGSNELITTGGTGPTNTMLGNAVEGIDLLLSGLNAVAAEDANVIPRLNNVLLEVGRVMSKDANGKLMKTVLKELLINLEKYFTKDGSVYSVNTDYHQDIAGTIYVDAELKNTVRELWPIIQLLMIKANRTDYAILKDAAGRSPLQVIAGALGKLGNNDIDFSTYTIEDSLKLLLENGATGEARSATDASYLERLLFTLGIAFNFGYKASMDDSNEPYPNFDRGHGASTNGVLTLNDSMYSLRSNEFLTFDAYGLALNKRTEQADFIGRSAVPFSVIVNPADPAPIKTSGHGFYMGYDFPVFCLLPAKCAGDAGLPNGGNKAVTLTPTVDDVTTGENYKTYFPKVGNGIGELNTATLIMGMIARICWEGEGPYYATAGATSGSVNGKSGTIYRRPDGRIYAVKEASGTYWYPADGGNDADADSDGWRENAYSEKLESDYYLVQAGFPYDDGSGSTYTHFCPPPINADNTVSGNGPKYVMGTTGDLKYKLRATDPDTPTITHTNAKQFVFWEKIRSNDTGRACATQEEAMVRNFQWLVNEKKFTFIIPMWLVAAGANSASYIVIEANGLSGLANATKGYDPADSTNPAKGNGFWVKALSDGTGVLDAAELTRRGWQVNYGDSYVPGDARIMVFCRESVAVSLDVIWQNILGKGRVLPEIIAQNMEPVSRMIFLTDGPSKSSMNTPKYSGDTSYWTTSDSIWTNRSKLFPLVVGAVGELHKCSYYENGSGDNNYYYAGTNHKYPIRTVLAGLIPPLVKPWMRHITVPEGKRWVPRIKYHPDNTTTVEPNNYAYLSPAVYWDGGSSTWIRTGPTAAGVDMRPRTEIRTLVNVITENNAGMHNGFIPLLVETKTVSSLLALLQRIEGGTVTQATKDKIFSGLEQVITAIKASKGNIIKKEELLTPTIYGDDSYCMVDYSKLKFLMFDYDNGNPDTGNPIKIRPVDTNLDILLKEAVGYRDVVAGATLTKTGKGFVGFIDRRNPLSASGAYTFYETYRHLPDGHHWDWSNFNSMMDGMRSMLADDGPNGTSYYIMQDVVELLDKFISRVTATDAELKAFRHTLGILMVTYAPQPPTPGGTWTYSTELTDILTNYLPDIMTTFTGHYDDLMLVAYNLFKPAGIMPSVFNGLSTSHSWADVFTEFDALLNDPFFVDPSARPSIWLGKNSLIELMVDMVDMIGEDWYTKLVFTGPVSNISPIDTLSAQEIEVLEFNPYKTLGQIMSVGGR